MDQRAKQRTKTTKFQKKTQGRIFMTLDLAVIFGYDNKCMYNNKNVDKLDFIKIKRNSVR